MASNDLIEGGGANAVVSHARTQGGEPMEFASRRLSQYANEGAVEIEVGRAVAEAQAAFVVALRNPRDEARSFYKMRQACLRLGLAESAFYKYSRGGESIEGPTIRLAEELARNWGNLDFGLKELSQGPGFSEMQAYCVDLEANVRSVQNFTVRHIRDTRGGAKELTDQRDIYEIAANMGSRRLRARILAILPQDYVDDAIEACKATLARKGSEKPLADRIKGMMKAFEVLGVDLKMMERKLGHPLGDTTPVEVVEMLAVHRAIVKEKVTTVADEFPPPGSLDGDDGPKGRGSGTGEAIKQGGKKKTETPAQTAAPGQAAAPPAAAAESPATTAAPAAAAAPAASTAPAPAPAPEAAPAAAAPAPAPVVEASSQTSPAPEQAAFEPQDADEF